MKNSSKSAPIIKYNTGVWVHFFLCAIDGGATLVAFFSLLFSRDLFLAYLVAFMWAVGALLVAWLMVLHNFMEKQREEREQKTENALVAYGWSTGCFTLCLVVLRGWIYVVRCNAHEACRSHVYAFLISIVTCLAVMMIKFMHATRANRSVRDFRLWLFVTPKKAPSA